MLPTSPPDPHDPPLAADRVTALIPLRTGGKSRLREELDGVGRAGLVLAMLDDVLSALHGAGITDIRVLCADSGAVAAAHARGLTVVPDPGAAEPDDHPVLSPDLPTAAGDRSLRRAVDAGLASVDPGRVRLVVAADLPLLTSDEVTAILASTADVTLAPTHGGGTAMLRLAGGVELPTRYGAASASAHLHLALEHGLSTARLDLPGARQDVDRAADLRALEGQGPLDAGFATSSFLSGRRG